MEGYVYVNRAALLSFFAVVAMVSGCQHMQVPDTAEPVTGWLHWRGPSQRGTSHENHLPDRWEPGGAYHLWSIDLPGRGTPVIARYSDGDRAYAWGYRGEKADLVEVLVCLDPDTGRIIWERAFPDFISDIIYDRYSIGSPTVDPDTGHVFLMTTPGLLMAFDRDGRMLWQRSMMEEFGRLTFPNGRTGAPSIEGDLVIVNTISTNWGREGPARNRFYAFDKHTGDLVWSSTPGVGPPFLKDSSFCSPVFESRDSKRLFYAGTGCGNIVCVDARTGDPIWRYQLAIGGVNSSVVLRGDTLIAIHGKENTDDTGRGRMVALRLGAGPPVGEKGPIELGVESELWRNNELSMFTSSPVVVGDRVYQVTVKGELECVDAKSGQILWHQKLGADQLHASPLYADGKLYVPMWHDGLYILRPGPAGAKVLDQIKLEGACLGSPSVWNGRIYVHTTSKLYCFGRTGFGGGGIRSGARLPFAEADPTEPARLQVVPAEVLMRPRTRQAFRLRALDEHGRLVETRSASQVAAKLNWSKFVPPTAKVPVELHADFNQRGELEAGTNARRSSGAFKVTSYLWGGGPDGPVARTATFRGRILPSPPYAEDFEAFDLKHTRKDGLKFAYPPLPWIGARLKWEVRDEGDGNKLLAKTLDRWLFQRSMVFIGHADDRDYTVAADVMTDGNRRGMSDVGLVNQRYIIVLRGNGQKIEVNSNIERLAQKAPFSWESKTWYRLKTRVDASEDGSGVVRAKAWPRDSEEPEAWTIEVPVPRVHDNGSPGLYGFSPNIRFAVYMDNISVTPNE